MQEERLQEIATVSLTTVTTDKEAQTERPQATLAAHRSSKLGERH